MSPLIALFCLVSVYSSCVVSKRTATVRQIAFPVMDIVGVVRDASAILSSHLELQQNLLPVTGVLQQSIKTSVYQSQCSYTIFKKCCLNHWTFSPSEHRKAWLRWRGPRGERSWGKNQLECWNEHLVGCRVCGWEKWRVLGDVRSGLVTMAIKLRMGHVSQLWL